MNRRNTRVLILFVVLIALLSISAAPAFAGSASVSGVFPANGGPTMPVVGISGGNCASQGSTPVQYDAYAFTVDAAGSYTLDLNFTGKLISLYLMNGTFNPASPLASCLAADNSKPISISAPLAANTTYYAVPFDDTFTQTGGSYTLTISGPGNVTFASDAIASKPASIDDGRLNAFDLAAPFALYCAADSFDIYAIDSAGAGTLALRVGSDAIAATDATAANALVAEGAGIRVFKLTTGELQAVSAPDFEGKVYNVIFSVFPCQLNETFLN
jgi:hypothetical protein